MRNQVLVSAALLGSFLCACSDPEVQVNQRTIGQVDSGAGAAGSDMAVSTEALPQLVYYTISDG